MEVTVSKILCLVSVLVFVLTAFGVTVAGATAVEMVSAGLAFFAASFLVP